MITGIIAAVIIFGMICAAGDGNMSSFWVGAVIVVILLLLGSSSREIDRAYNNATDYWARGGPKRERR